MEKWIIWQHSFNNNYGQGLQQEGMLETLWQPAGKAANELHYCWFASKR